MHRHLITAATVTALLMVPTLAIAAPGHPNNGNKGAGHGVTGATGATGNHGANGKAYGRLCQSQSKKHVKGQKGTPFSRCVSAAAKLRGNKGATGPTGATGATGPGGS